MHTRPSTVSPGCKAAWMILPGMVHLLSVTVCLLLLCSSPVMAANREIDAALRRGDHQAAITLLSKQLKHTALQPTDRAITLDETITHHFLILSNEALPCMFCSHSVFC